MLTRVATFTRADAVSVLANGFPWDHPFARMRRAWVGFAVDSDGPSPLLTYNDGLSLVLRVADMNYPPERDESEARSLRSFDIVPTLRHARHLVNFVLELHSYSQHIALCVHCHAGLHRSGAVAEWVHRDLGVIEDECSNRIKVCGNMDPTANPTILRLLRTAHREAKVR